MSRKKNSKQIRELYKIIVLIICIIASIFCGQEILNNTEKNEVITSQAITNIEEIPSYTDKIYIEINNNIPYFKENEYTTEPFEKYSELDNLGRCGVAYANICKEIMPTKEREDISNIKPTG